MTPRLSRKAQEEAAKLSGDLDESIRKVAAAFAITQGREFADEQDVKKAYRGLILEIASDLHKQDPAEPLHLPRRCGCGTGTPHSLFCPQYVAPTGVDH